MRIGELAKRSGVSPKALRHYERVGVMPPPSRTASGYRDYAPEAMQRLEFITAGQRVGLSLRQLAKILEVRDGGQAPCAEALALVDERLRDVEESIARLEALRAELVVVAERGRRVDPHDCAAESVCAVINPLVETARST